MSAGVTVWRIGYCPSPVPEARQLLRHLGYGATLGSGRWHRMSPRMLVYAGATRALCHLEKRVHCNGVHPVHQAMFRLTLPEGAPIQRASDLGLKADWRDDVAHTQALGMAWLDAEDSLGLWVPSFVVNGDFNLLINPYHEAYRLMAVVVEEFPFQLDGRLF